MILGYILIILALLLAGYDFRFRRLPNGLILLLACAGIYQAWSNGDIVLAGAAGLAGFVLFYIMKISYKNMRSADGLGMGDVKLMGAIGLWVGFAGLPWVLFIGSFLTLLYAILITMLGRSLLHEARLPFGSFLCIALALVYFYQ